MLEQCQVPWVGLKMRRQPLRVEKFEPQILRSRLQTNVFGDYSQKGSWSRRSLGKALSCLSNAGSPGWALKMRRQPLRVEEFKLQILRLCLHTNFWV
jgi:hypothetical protein